MVSKKKFPIKKNKKNVKNNVYLGKENGKAKEYNAKEEEEINQKTNAVLIQKKGMDKPLKQFCLDFVKLFAPYSIRFYIKNKERLAELNTTLKQLSYVYSNFFSMHHGKLLYNIMNIQSKLVLTFFVQTYTNSNAFQVKGDIEADHKKLPPLLVLKNFNSETNSDLSNYLVIIQNVLKNMFPKISLKKNVLSKSIRIVLYYYDKKEQAIYFRQYVRVPTDEWGVDKLLSTAANKNLSKYNDISNYVYKKLDINNLKDQDKIQLKEIGPRATLKLYKILDQDTVIYPVKSSTEF